MIQQKCATSLKIKPLFRHQLSTIQNTNFKGDNSVEEIDLLEVVKFE